MQVNNLNGVPNIYQNPNAEIRKTDNDMTQAKPPAVRTDEAVFSYDHAKANEELISKVKKQVVDSAGNRDQAGKIEALKTQIESGHYVIDPTAIAESMLSAEE
jgi:anti-sigma28 factor (negative regulator of flagellin synthesis)